MADQTQTTTGSTAAVASNTQGLPTLKLPSPTDIYDALMGDIELDLISVSLPKLDEKYKNETEEARKARMERYSKAFTEFDKRYDAWISKMKKLFSDYQRKALKLAEEKTKEQEEQTLADFEAQFNAATS